MGHFLFESTELINRSEALYGSLTVLACVNNFVITTWKMENFRMLIGRLENIFLKTVSLSSDFSSHDKKMKEFLGYLSR